jgi:hypothetical protein
VKERSGAVNDVIERWPREYAEGVEATVIEVGSPNPGDSSTGHSHQFSPGGTSAQFHRS